MGAPKKRLTQPTFARNLRLAMDGRGVRVRLLAQAAGVHEVTLSQWRSESYPKGPPREMIRRVLEYWLELPPHWLERHQPDHAPLERPASRLINSWQAWLSGKEPVETPVYRDTPSNRAAGLAVAERDLVLQFEELRTRLARLEKLLEAGEEAEATRGEAVLSDERRVAAKLAEQQGARGKARRTGA